jgi:hypothetical protein
MAEEDYIFAKPVIPAIGTCTKIKSIRCFIKGNILKEWGLIK